MERLSDTVVGDESRDTFWHTERGRMVASFLFAMFSPIIVCGGAFLGVLGFLYLTIRKLWKEAS